MAADPQDAREALARLIEPEIKSWSGKGGNPSMAAYDAAAVALAAGYTLRPPQPKTPDPQDGARPLPFDRDVLGRMVREAWVRWAQTQPNPKPSWLVPYDELAEPDKEADRQIGEAIARWTLIGDAARQPEAQAAPAEVLEMAQQLATAWREVAKPPLDVRFARALLASDAALTAERERADRAEQERDISDNALKHHLRASATAHHNLAARAEAAEASNAKLREALISYGIHRLGCDSKFGIDNRCTCGLVAALATPSTEADHGR